MIMPTTSELYKVILDSSAGVPDKIKLMNEVRKINTAEGDRWVYRPVAYLLGAIPLVLIISYAVGWVKEMNDGLLSLSSAAVGALASFLTTGVSSKTSSGEIESIVNPKVDAVAAPVDTKLEVVAASKPEAVPVVADQPVV